MPTADPENLPRRAEENSKAIFIESVSNPSNVIGDIEAIAEIARDAGIPLIVDNTMATPYPVQTDRLRRRYRLTFTDQVF